MTFVTTSRAFQLLSATVFCMGFPLPDSDIGWSSWTNRGFAKFRVHEDFQTHDWRGIHQGWGMIAFLLDLNPSAGLWEMTPLAVDLCELTPENVFVPLFCVEKSYGVRSGLHSFRSDREVADLVSEIESQRCLWVSDHSEPWRELVCVATRYEIRRFNDHSGFLSPSTLSRPTFTSVEPLLETAAGFQTWPALLPVVDVFTADGMLWDEAFLAADSIYRG